MRHRSRISLFAALVAAVTISACSDGTAPIPASGLSTLSDKSAGNPHDIIDAASFTSIDFPGATATVSFAINNEGVAVGRYVTAGRTHGFMRSAKGELSTIDFPGSGFTVAGAINTRGDIVGWYTLPATSAVRHGYLLRNGEFTTFDPPGSVFTNALGINDRGDIVGRFCTHAPCREPGSGDFHGFLLRDGEFTIIDIPGSNETNAWKVNDRGEILGGFGVTGGAVRMFLIRNGELTTLPSPNGSPLSEDNGGISASGDIAGKFCDASPCFSGPTGSHGFAILGGHFVRIDKPGALGTAAFGINARRDVVGGYFDVSGVLHGYVLRL